MIDFHEFKIKLFKSIEIVLFKLILVTTVRNIYENTFAQSILTEQIESLFM